MLLAHILFKAGPHHHDHDHGDDSHPEWKIRFRNRIKRKFAGKENVEEGNEEEQSSETT